jgi:nitroreductase
MLALFNERKTQRAFLASAVSDDHVTAIVAAGCSAPTKQRIYPYRIIALTQSDRAKEIKQRLFLESFVNQQVNKHLLTAQAPLLAFWVGRYLPDNGDMGLSTNDENMRSKALAWDPGKASADSLSWIRARADKDCAISAAFSMIQAEALGYSTAFNDCYDKEKAWEILGLEAYQWTSMVLAVGRPDDQQQRQRIYRDGRYFGWSDPRPFAEPAKLGPEHLVELI